MPNQQIASQSKPTLPTSDSMKTKELLTSAKSKLGSLYPATIGDRIFYRKAMLACGGQVWHHLAFEYPAIQKRAFDLFVTRASYALQAYGQVGCQQ